MLGAALALTNTLPARAAELGELEVHSGLGEPLLAEIEIVSLRPGEEDSLGARLATPGAFIAAGIEYPPALHGLRLGIETRGARKLVRITTARPLAASELRLLVDLESSAGRTRREYTLFMDPAAPARSALTAKQKPASSIRTTSAAPAALEAEASPRRQAEARPLPVEVFINNARAGDWLLLDVGGAFYATREAFEAWRVIPAPGVQGIIYRGELWFPLSAVPGYEAQFEAPTQSLRLKFSPNAFAATRLAAPADERPAITPAVTSIFANYDLSYTHTSIRGIPDTKDLGALTELGLSSGLGVLTNSSVGRNLANDPALTPPEFVRLETTFTRDFPEHNTSLRLGDTATRPGTWGRQVYFGGVQFGRNFALSPGFVTQPIPVLSGQSSAPSTVELFINDALRQTSQVPSGPFTIENYPLLTGTGQARLVVRDLLGRETVMVQNFFTSNYLLRAGLSDWTAQAGAVRRNLGTDSANYGEGFASGVLRHGVSDNLTLETQGELSERVRGAGLGFSAGLFSQVLGQAAIAASKSRSGEDGYLWVLGAEHLSLRHGFTLHYEGATRDYLRVGQNDSFQTYKGQVLASYTYFTERRGQHLGLAYGRVSTFDEGPITTYSANYTVRIGRTSSLTFTATRVRGVADSNAVGVNLLIPFDAQTTFAGVATRREGGTDSYASASKTLGMESGSGWRALAGKRLGQEYAEGGYYYQGRYGLVGADAMASEDQQTLRLGAQGALVGIGGRVFASRRMLDSFALVEVPGYPNVGVGFQSTVLTRTDAQGQALVPQLGAYRRNAVRLDPSELPISAELDDIEIVAVPPARSGVRLTFPVRAGRGALITIHFEDGAPAPAGAEVELVGDAKEFFVARRGEAFVTGLQPKNRLVVKWSGQACTLDVELPPGDKDEIARLGPYVCTGVKR